MLRVTKLFPAALLFMALAIPQAHAAKGHFISGQASVTDGELSPARVGFHGGLQVTFVEAGLGSNAGTNYLVTADASATYACINNGGNKPQAQNKETITGPVSGSATFTSDKNGKVSGSLNIAPLPPGAITCPSGQTLYLIEVSYTNVVLTDTTNGVTLSIPGTFSLNFLQ